MSPVADSSPHSAPAPRIPSVLQAVLIWLSAAAVMLAASMAVATAAAAVAVADGVPPLKLLTDPTTSPLLNDPVWIAVGTAANGLAVGLVLLVWVLGLRPAPALAFPLQRPSALAVVGSLLVVFGLAPLAELAGAVADRIVQGDVTAARIITAAAKNASTGELALLLVCVAVLPAVFEEAMFRGLVTATFARHSYVMGLVVPSILFGIFHLEPTQIAGTIVLGFGFGIARLHTGSLVSCALAHGIYNAAVVLAVRHADVGHDRSFSPGPLLLGALLFALGMFLLRRARPAALSSPATAETPLPPPA